MAVVTFGDVHVVEYFFWRGSRLITGGPCPSSGITQGISGVARRRGEARRRRRGVHRGLQNIGGMRRKYSGGKNTF